MDLFTGMPIMDKEIEGLLYGSWAGAVLQLMQDHHRHRQLAAELASPEKAHERRAEKKRKRQLVHLDRLAAKLKRHAVWRDRPESVRPGFSDLTS